MTGSPASLVAFATLWPMKYTPTVSRPSPCLASAMSEKRTPEGQRLGAIIKEWRLDRSLSRPALAREVARRGVSTTADYLAKLEDGWRSFANAKLELREAIREAMQISPQEWREKTGLFVPLAPGEVVPGGTIEKLTDDIHSGMRQIPVYDLIDAGPGGDGGTIVEYIDIPEAWKGHYAAYKVSGDSMSPYIPDKAKIVVRVQDHSDNGDIIACYAGDHGNVVKVLRGVADDGTVTLTSLNPNYPPIWAPYIHVFGVVIEIRMAPPVIDRNGNGRHPKTN